MLTLREVNLVAAEDFTANFAGIFEHSPWVAERAAARRPFASRLALLDAMREVVARASPEEQLALIRAHPRLGSKGRPAVDLTVASAREQRKAGLDACTAEDLVRLGELNDAYEDKFGMPFILAVRGHDPQSIIANCAQRLSHDAAAERGTALQQIGLIAGYRLADVIASPASGEVLAMSERLSASMNREGLIREWMNAADLEHLAAPQSAVPPAAIVGRRRGAADATETLLLGAHVDPETHALVSDGRLGFLLALAILQQLRQKDVWLEFDLVVIVTPDDPDLGDAAELAEIAQNAALVTVRGFGERAFAVSRRSGSRATPPQNPAWDAPLLNQAVFSLEDFLLHHEQTFDDHGTLGAR